MSKYIEVPKDYADAKGDLMQMYTLINGGRYFVEYAEKEKHPNQLLIQTAPVVDLDPSELKKYP